MPDITMCSGNACPLRMKCYRFLAIPSEYRQSYFAIVPYADKDGKISCEHFWKHDGERPTRNIDESSSEELSGETSMV